MQRHMECVSFLRGLHVRSRGNAVVPRSDHHNVILEAIITCSDAQKEITGKLFEPPGDFPLAPKVSFDLTSTSVVYV